MMASVALTGCGCGIIGGRASNAIVGGVGVVSRTAAVRPVRQRKTATVATTLSFRMATVERQNHTALASASRRGRKRRSSSSFVAVAGEGNGAFMLRPRSSVRRLLTESGCGTRRRSNNNINNNNSSKITGNNNNNRGSRFESTSSRNNMNHSNAALPPGHPLLRLLGQSARHALLKPRSLPLPRYISPQHYSFTLSEAFGHTSFVLVAASYATQDFLELRTMAVLGSTSMLFFTYFHPHGRVLWLPLKWNLLFIAINSYRIGKVLYDRYMSTGLSDELKTFREDHLNVVDAVDWYKLVSIGTEEVFEEGDLVLQQGRDNHSIRIVLEGELEVLRDGTLTYVVQKGNFVSESGLHAGLMLRGSIESCGTIVAGPPFDPQGRNDDAAQPQQRGRAKNRARCLRWNRAELVDLLEEDKGLRNALQAALSWDIVRKLKMQRQMLLEGRVKDPKVWTKMREDQGISRYASILQNMLRHPEEIEDMSKVLTEYRMIHHIDDGDHERALAKCGWTEEEFRSGKRHDLEEDEDIEEEEFESARWRRVKRYSSKVVRSLQRMRTTAP